MNREMIEIYSDFLITSFGQTSATNLEKALDAEISHDAITRFLSDRLFTSRDYWKLVKPVIRKVQTEDAFLALDDFIVEKPDSEENASISYHYDHTQNCSVKGFNVLDVVYVNEEARVPLDFEMILKSDYAFDPIQGKWRRTAFETKQALFRKMLTNAKANNVLFKVVLADTWFSSVENMIFIKFDLGKDFIFPIKTNRKVKLMNVEQKPYQAVESLNLEEGIVYQARLEGVPFVVSLTKVIFKNEDASAGVLFLVSSLLDWNAAELVSGYHKRWRVEEQHKSLKQNASVGRSSGRCEMVRLNHLFCSFVGVLKLECMRLSIGLNPFALRAKLYLKALKASMAELNAIRGENAFSCFKPA